MKLALVFVTLGLAGPASAVVAPVYQNNWDLNVMVDFVRQYPRVMESLRAIDFEKKVVHFGKDCKAQFGREPVPPGPPRAGPMPALVFVSATCPLGEPRPKAAGQSN